MIPTPAITAWSVTAPWSTRGQVEQDLILSRLIVEIANDPYPSDKNSSSVAAPASTSCT